jgi:hypothetical protein
VHRATVFEHLARQGIHPQRNLRKLSDEHVTAAVELYESGWSLKKLGTEYGVDAETVRQAFKRAGVRMRPRPGWST